MEIAIDGPVLELCGISSLAIACQKAASEYHKMVAFQLSDLI
jgi:hypothetical protein